MKLKGLRKLACMAMVTTFLVTSAAQLGTVYAAETAQTAIVEVAEETGASPVVAAEGDQTEAEEEAAKDSLTVAAKKSYTYAFDINSASNAKATVELKGLVTVVNNDDSNKTYDGAEASKGKWLFSTDKTTFKAASGVSVKTVTTAVDKKTVTITAEVTKDFIAKANVTKTLYLAYKKSESDTELINVPFTIKRTPDTFGTAADATNETKVVTASNVTSFSYTGANPYLVVNSKYGTKKVNAIEQIKNNAIESVVVMDGVTTLKAGAIVKDSSTNTKLTTVILPDSITTVDNGAISGSGFTVICSDKVGNLIKAGSSNVQTYTASTTKAAKYASGSEVEVNLKTMKIGGTSGKDLMAIGDSVANIKAIAESKTAVEDVKWMVCKPGTLTASSSATIKDAKNTATGSASITLTSLKSKGDFNEKVDIVALSKSTGRVYARGTLYITPEVATEWKTETKYVYADDKVEIVEGKTSKIPYALKDGKDKTLIYTIGAGDGEDASCISITNGTIKAIKPGKCRVVVTPRVGSGLEKTIAVEVKAKTAKALKASVSAITLEKDSEEAQEFTVFADTLSAGLGNVTAEIVGKNANLKIQYWNGSNWTDVDAGASLGTATVGKFKVYAKDGATVNDTIVLKSGSLKETKIKVSTKDAWTTPVKFAQPSSKKSIDIPVGTTRKLGLSLPATGRCDYDVFVKKAGATTNGGYVTSGLTNCGDILTADEVGKYEVYAMSKQTRKLLISVPSSISGLPSGTDKVTIGKTTYVEFNVPVVVSDTFTVNVYKPVSTLVFGAKASDDAESIVQGGYLIKQSEADWDCNKSFKTGEYTTLDFPYFGGGSEEIIWTVSKPGAVTIGASGSALKLNFNAAGKYTVTGTTKYTKTKVKFNVQVDAPTVAEWKTATAASSLSVTPVKIDTKDATVVTNLDSEVTMKKGESANWALLIKTANAGGSVKFESSDKTVATINATSGAIKALKAGTTDIKITLSPSNAKKTDTFTAVTKTIKVTVTE